MLSLGILFILGVFIAVTPPPGAGAHDHRHGAAGLIESIASPDQRPPPSSHQSTLPPLLPPEHIDAKAYLVQMLDSGDTLLEHNSNEALPPASLTKLLTVLIATDELASQQAITFSRDAKEIGEKISFVKIGETLPRDEVIKLALIESANDAASALAETVGRRHGAQTFSDAMTVFVSLMNERARALGLADSHFENPVGLDEKNHLISVRDLAKIARAIMLAHPEIFTLSRWQSAIVTTSDKHTYSIRNTNELLKEFPNILGSKTGMTQKALGALLLLYPVGIGNRTAVIIILGSENRFGDGRQLIHWLEINNAAIPQ